MTESAGDLTKLTMNEMSAIAFAKFNGAVLKGKKEDFVRSLNGLIAAQPTMLNLGAPAAIPTLTVATPEHAPAAPALRVPLSLRHDSHISSL